MAETDYQLKLAVFEGPFDLLLYLIKKNQIDIYDIPIAKITAEYLEYIDMMRNMNLDIASEFIVIAATLIYIKAKMLLPRDEILETDEDPRTELVQHLIEYSMFKEISDRMKIYEDRKRELFERLYPINISPEDKEVTLDTYALVKAMDEVLGRVKERKTVFMPGENIKVKDRIYEIIGKLRATDKISFFDMCDDEKSKLYVVALFLAMLELLRLNVINVYQDKLFGDLRLYLVNDNFDMEIFKNLQD
ncbi:MAG: segregation/condensation protein A [bacterium]